jgi:hypothetical protein
VLIAFQVERYYRRQRNVRRYQNYEMLNCGLVLGKVRNTEIRSINLSDID